MTICETYLQQRHEIEIVDLLKIRNRRRLTRSSRYPRRPLLPNTDEKDIGDLSDAERVLVGLQIRADSGDSISSNARARDSSRRSRIA